MKKLIISTTVLLISSLAALHAREITVDFAKNTGVIKPLHGVNNSPIALRRPPAGFKAAGIPYTRLHDTSGAWGGTHYVDVNNIFPDFDADPDDPESYDFAFTDAYLKQLVASGTKIFYRLGPTIENNYRIKAYNIYPPKDYNKYAKICANIIRHYNHGWAKGFKYNIEYWEIWNEPENPPMWQGTKEQFFELYRVIANHLKKEFPYIKVGGYGSCGFYAVTQPNRSAFFKSFIPYFIDFLKFIKAEKTKAPLDFYSWHLYTTDPEEIIKHAEFVEKTLHEHGFKNTENIFNEWNYVVKHTNAAHVYNSMKEAPGASFVASAFSLMQNSPVDKAMYYDATPTRGYGGLYYFPGSVLTPTYHVFYGFNQLYQLKNAKLISGTGKGIYGCAAGKEKDFSIMLANPTAKTQKVKLTLKNAPKTAAESWIIDADRAFVKIKADYKNITLPPTSVLLITTLKVKNQSTPSYIRGNFAALDEEGAKERSKKK